MSTNEPVPDDTIDEVEREVEPETIGVFSAIVRETCTYYDGDSPADVTSCGEPATHSVALYDGDDVVTFAVCDEHGEPEKVPDDRRWSGERA